MTLIFTKIWYFIPQWKYFYIWTKNILKLNEHQHHHSKWTVTVSNLLWCLRIFSIETSQLMKGNRFLYQSHGRQKHKYGNVVILSINVAFLHVSIYVQEYFFFSKLWKCHRFENLHKQKCLFISTYIYIYIYVCVCVCVYIYMYICMYVCMSESYICLCVL